jgi:hypothetical protein
MNLLFRITFLNINLMKKIKILSFLIFALLSSTVYSQDLSQVKNSKPFSMTGIISAGGFVYNASGIADRQQPFGYSLGANLNFNIYGVSIPFFASFNEQGGAFQHPFNRYGISPKYKWAQLHLGWRNMNLSQFTLSNTTYLGAGLELNPGRFRFASMYGRLKQPEAFQNINFQVPQFERKAMAIKLGVGTEQNYFDLIIFKAKDDIFSLKQPDSITSQIPAHENLVIGVKQKISMLKQKLIFQYDASLSAFSNDIRAPEVSISEIEHLNWLNILYTPSLSTSVNYAGEASLNYSHKLFSIGGKYRRVMPDFNTLGSEYILNDLEAITINPSINLLKGKAILSSSIGRQRNNLDGNRLSTNERLISSVSLNVNPSPYWGATISYSNYTFHQQVLLDSFYNDSMVVNQLNQNINFIPRLTLIKENYIHNLVLTANYQVLKDQNKITAETGSNNMLLSSLMYVLMVKKHALNLRMGMNYFKFNSGIVDIQRVGVNFGGGKKFFSNKLQANLNCTLNRQDDSFNPSNLMTVNASINYKVFNKTSLGVQVYMNNIDSKSRNYSEQRVQFRVSQGF